jgi:hypothetical protein
MIIETDIGNDPDDALALTYLIYNNVEISAILIQPGFIGQCCIVKEIFRNLNKTTPLIFQDSVMDDSKFVLSNFHKAIVKNTNYAYDGVSKDYLKDNRSDEDIFIIGPPKGLVDDILDNDGNYSKNKMLMEGGYISYEDVEEYGITLEHKSNDFIGHKMYQSYNSCGISKNFDGFINSFTPENVHFITKSLNHTMTYNGQKSQFKYLQYLFDNIKSGKKMHDLVAAYSYLHKHKLKIVKGEMKIMGQKNYVELYSSINHNIIVDVDREHFWKSI